MTTVLDCVGITLVSASMISCMLMGPSRSSPDWIPVASFVPTDVDAEVIEQALCAAKVPFRSEGSRATQILVAHEDTARAVEALKHSPVASHVHFYPSTRRAGG